MRTLIFFIFTVFTSFCLMLSALVTKANILPHYGVSFALWILFILYFSKQQRKKRLRRENEEMLNEYLRDRLGRY